MAQIGRLPVALLIFLSPVLAQADSRDVTVAPLGPAGGKSAAAPLVEKPAPAIIVSHNDCDYITAHRPAPDVAYRPGVDVHGKPVVPADLPGNPNAVPPQIEIYVKVPPASLPPGVRAQLQNSDVYASRVSVDLLSNRVLVNGEPLQDPALQAIAQECQRSRATP